MNSTRIGVMIASPGDATQERQAITDTILSWNAIFGPTLKVVLEPVKWETHATIGLRGRPQGMINEELIPKSDFLVAVFRSRIGSPTGVEDSGTIEEIKEFVKLGKHAAVYFYKGEVPINSIDHEQLKSLGAFKKELRSKGLIGEYSSAEELKNFMLAHLQMMVTKVLPDIMMQCPSDQAPRKPKRTTKPTARPKKTDKLHHAKTPRTDDGKDLTITSSDNWGMINGIFYMFDEVAQSDSTHFVVKLTTSDSSAMDQLNSLRPHRIGSGKPYSYASGSDAYLVKTVDLNSVSKGEKTEWTIKAAKLDIDYGGGIMESSLTTNGISYTADEIATMRGRVILLGETDLLRNTDSSTHSFGLESMLGIFVQGINTPLRIQNSLIQVMATKLGDNGASDFLKCARLAAIFQLKAGGVVERIELLHLGPLVKRSLHVKFRGYRQEKYSNVSAFVMEIEGECKLPPQS